MFEYVEFIQVPKGVDLKSEDAHFFYGQAATMNAVSMLLYDCTRARVQGHDCEDVRTCAYLSICEVVCSAALMWHSRCNKYRNVST